MTSQYDAGMEDGLPVPGEHSRASASCETALAERQRSVRVGLWVARMAAALGVLRARTRRRARERAELDASKVALKLRHLNEQRERRSHEATLRRTELELDSGEEQACSPLDGGSSLSFSDDGLASPSSPIDLDLETPGGRTAADSPARERRGSGIGKYGLASGIGIGMGMGFGSAQTNSFHCVEWPEEALSPEVRGGAEDNGEAGSRQQEESGAGRYGGRKGSGGPRKQRVVVQQYGRPECHKHARRTGWLYKQGGRHKNWKSRFFVLEHGCLSYYTSETCLTLKGSLMLETDVLEPCHVTSAACGGPKPPARASALHPPAKLLARAAKPARGGDVFGVLTPRRTYLMMARSAEERGGWIASIDEAVRACGGTRFQRSRARCFRQGHLLKRTSGTMVKAWKVRYCVVTDGRLDMYAGGMEWAGGIDLVQAQVVWEGGTDVDDGIDQEAVVLGGGKPVRHGGQHWIQFRVQTPRGDKVYLAGRDYQDVQAWARAIEAANHRPEQAEAATSSAGWVAVQRSSARGIGEWEVCYARLGVHQLDCFTKQPLPGPAAAAEGFRGRLRLRGEVRVTVVTPGEKAGTRSPLTLSPLERSLQCSAAAAGGGFSHIFSLETRTQHLHLATRGPEGLHWWVRALELCVSLRSCIPVFLPSSSMCLVDRDSALTAAQVISEARAAEEGPCVVDHSQYELYLRSPSCGAGGSRRLLRHEHVAAALRAAQWDSIVVDIMEQQVPRYNFCVRKLLTLADLRLTAICNIAQGRFVESDTDTDSDSDAESTATDLVPYIAGPSKWRVARPSRGLKVQSANV